MARRHVALNGIPSSHLPVQASAPQGSVLGPVHFLVFINDISDSGKSSISLLITPPSDVPAVIPQTGKPELLRSLQIWIKSQTGPTRGTCFSILTNLTLSLCLSEWTIWKPPIYFLNNHLEEVLSLKLLGLTICHDLSWKSHKKAGKVW